MRGKSRRGRLWLAVVTPYRRWCARNSIGHYAQAPPLTTQVGAVGPLGAPAARRDRVAANARLTGATAAVLFILLAIEGATIVRIAPLLRIHVVLGMVLVPVVLLKIASTTYRFARYYLKDADFRAKGPPPTALRLLGPLLVILTVILFATGIVLVFAGQTSTLGQHLLLAHKVSFVGWFVVLAVHVIAHIGETAHLAPKDWYGRTRRQVVGASRRQWALAGSVCIGAVLGAALLPQIAHYLKG